MLTYADVCGRMQVQASVAAPESLRPLTAADKSVLILGASYVPLLLLTYADVCLTYALRILRPLTAADKSVLILGASYCLSSC
jgi:hypothetical protein